MATRKAELEIKLQNAKSISDLESVIKEINGELKQLDVNSAAFSELAETSKKAGTQLKDIKGELQAISSEKQIDGVAKLGGALAAGFSVATIAASKFGEETNENVQKAIQTGVELSVVLQSIKAITEGLSASNRKAIGELISGFTKAGIGAKLFGNTTRIAIASTGIGLLIVGLGTLIANWDSVTAAVGRFIDQIPFLAKIRETIKNIADEVGSLSNLFNALGAGIKGLFTAGTSFAREFYAELQNGKALAALEQQLELLDKQNFALELRIKLLQAQGNQENEIIRQKRLAYENEIIALLEIQELRDLTDDEQKRLENAKVELQILKLQGVELAKNAARRRSDARADDVNKREQEAVNAEIEAEERRKKMREKAENELLDLFKERKVEEEKIEVNMEAETYERSAKTRRQLYDEWLKDFEETVSKIQPFVDATIQGIANISNALVSGLQTQIDTLTMQIDVFDDRYNESIENRKALEAQLSEVQGAAREQVLEGIEAERKESNRLANERRKLENQKAKAQNKINEIEWLNTIVQTIANTARGVTAALAVPPPAGPILAAINGALGGVQIGIVSSNKPKPIPTFASGGYTQSLGFADSTGHNVAGVVHANEYVVPSNVLNSKTGQRLVDVLEAMRTNMGGFASGGFTSEAVPDVVPSVDTNEAFIALANRPIYASWTEAREVGSRVEFVESRASI